MKSLKDTLEFDQLLKEVSKFSISEAGKRGVLELKAMENIDQSREEFDRMIELEDILEDMPLFSELEWIPDLLSMDVIEPIGLVKIAHLLEYVEDISLFLKEKARAIFLLSSLFPLPEIKDAINKCIDMEGEIKEDATDTLRNLFREKSRVEERLKKAIQKFLEENQDVVQENLVTQRKGRNVIPIKKGFVKDTYGVVVDISRSGETVFVEPMEAVYLNNKLTELHLEIEREKHRILLKLTEMVKSQRDYLLSDFETVLKLDTMVARIRYRRKFNGVYPEILNKPGFFLKGVRHPLLAIKGYAVPQDVLLGINYRTIVVSGPNAGGKTVLLKTIGIALLSVFYGIPLLADEGTQLGNIGNIFAVIEDEQSIEEGLSSFTSHLLRIKSVLDKAGGGDVVLIDEIGGGTDPVEGSALAASILLELHKRGCLTVATTHLSSLKFHIHEIEGMVNGAMEFKDRPTYKLVIGIPGVSMAIETAKRAGLPEVIIKRAEKYVQEDELKIGKLLSEYQKRLSEVRELNRQIEERERELRRIENEYKERIKNINKEKKKILKEARIEAEEIIKDARSLVEKTIKEIRESQASKDSIKRYKREFDNRLTGTEDESISIPEVEMGLKGETHTYADVEKLEIDVRGFFREDAVEQVDRFIDRAYLHGVSKVYVIHGKGTGILKNTIRDFLSKDRRVRNFTPAPPEEGGDGVTIVEIE